MSERQRRWEEMIEAIRPREEPPEQAAARLRQALQEIRRESWSWRNVESIAAVALGEEPNW